MKQRTILLLLSLLAFTVSAQQQKSSGLLAQSAATTLTRNAGDLYIIPKVGFNYANITKLHGDARMGLNVGLSGEYFVKQDIAIEGGLYYSMQGTDFKFTNAVKFGLNNDYINVPVYLKGYIADGFHIFAGPQFGFLINSKLKAKTGIGIVDDIVNILANGLVDFKEYVNTFDFAVSIGAGYELSMGLTISANYNLGLTKVPKLPDFTYGKHSYDLNPDALNNVLQINLGYKF